MFIGMEIPKLDKKEMFLRRWLKRLERTEQISKVQTRSLDFITSGLRKNVNLNINISDMSQAIFYLSSSNNT